MQEHIYTAKRKKIIGQTWTIWVYVAMQVWATIALIIKQPYNYIGAIVLISVLFGSLNAFAISLFIRYYKHSVGKKFIITYNTLQYVDDKTGESTELINTEIEKVLLVETHFASRSPWPWYSHEYFMLMDAKGNRIIVTSYIMDLGDFWQDMLRARVSSDNIVREKKMYPWF